uniref:Resolvase/invertase-type recombinase catalytic domain-containing protein n=1 Tax=viral metagenome TaxID=1070528 RepID=A0A6C0CCE0_9ZZZZ
MTILFLIFLNYQNLCNVIYAHVSTYKQRKDLRHQIDFLSQFCSNNNFDIDHVYSDISSGMNIDCPDFSVMLDLVFKHKIKNIFISNKDRLTRLSFITLESIFKKFGTNIIVVNKDSDHKYGDFFDEIISIMHYFSTKQYSNRRKFYRF